MQNIFIDILPPWVETGLQPAFYDLESGTVLQQTARMYAKVRELNEAFNQFSEDVSNEINSFERETNAEIERFEGVINATVEEYIEKFNQLHDYVEDYFDNLDVQEEINNKLDQMAEDGQLADIISQYLNSTAVFGYDTVADMKSATNLVNGSFARTLGYTSKNDGGASLYKIRYITNDDVVDEGSIITMTADPDDHLIAELIVEDNTIDVKQFGAIGDGIADDTVAIQKALTFGIGKTVLINNGVYLINDTIDASGNDIVGNAIIKAMPSFDGNQLIMPHNTVSIDGLMLDCNNSSISAIGNSTDCSSLTLKNCQFKGAKRYVGNNNFALNSCVYLTGKDNIMTNCKVYDNLSHGCRIYSKVAHSNVNIDNCEFNNNGSRDPSHPVVAIGLVQYEGENGTLYDKVTISNCYATGNANSGIAPHSCNNLTITNCVSNYNHEHGFCVMDGKNSTISNCIAVENDRFGIRIQGDYTSSDIYHGYVNCTVTGCYIKGGGFDIDENIDTVTITGNTVVNGTASGLDYTRGVQIGRSNKPFSKTTNINITDNSFIGYDKYTAIVCSIVLNNTCRFENTLDGKVIENYRLGTQVDLMNTCSNVKIGESNNILSNAEDISQWTMVNGASVTDGVITKGTTNYVAYTRSNLAKCPRFVSVMMKAEPEDEENPEKSRIGIRFRSSSDALVSGDYIAENDYVIDGYYCRVWDLSLVENLTKESVAKIEVMLWLGPDTSSLKVDGIYCALSEEPPILQNVL